MQREAITRYNLPGRHVWVVKIAIVAADAVDP